MRHKRSVITNQRSRTRAPGWRRVAVRAAVGVALVATIVPVTASAQPPQEIDGNGNTNDPAVDLPNSPTAGHDPDVKRMPTTTAAAAIVVDRTTGEVLGAKNPDRHLAPASTTKMMTGLLAVEAINAGTVSLSDIVTIQSDVNIEGGGAIGLAPGDTISLYDLLNIAMLESKGDAASAVGTYIGSQPWGDPSWMGRAQFVASMNDRARELGLDDTRYIDISGRDPSDLGDDSAGHDGIPGTGQWPAQEHCIGNNFSTPPCAHYSTARDLAALARVALDEPLFAAFVKRTNASTTTWRSPTGAPRDIPLSNTNQLLPGKSQAYTGAYGVKTGTSHTAKENLVSAARNELILPNDHRIGTATPLVRKDVIAVVLGSDDKASTPDDRFTDSRALLDFGLDRTG